MKPTIWVERYRPKTISDVIFQDERQRKAFTGFIEAGDIPHILMSGVQGTGKTTISKALIRDLGVEKADVLRINCSDEKIDALRNKVSGFAMTIPLGKFKVVQLEECLQGDTLVRVLRDGVEQSIPIRDINQASDLVRSYKHGIGTVWLPFLKKNQGKRQLIKVTFENGDVIQTTHNHPWVLPDNSIIKSSNLLPGTEIFSPSINRLSMNRRARNGQPAENNKN